MTLGSWRDERDNIRLSRYDVYALPGDGTMGPDRSLDLMLSQYEEGLHEYTRRDCTRAG